MGLRLQPHFCAQFRADFRADFEAKINSKSEITVRKKKTDFRPQNAGKH